MRKLTKLVAAAAALATPVLGLAAPANATPPSGYGFDGTAHTIISAGSDTTYRAVVGITTLYNGSPGCSVTTAAPSPDLNKCVSVGTAESTTLSNYQHDTVGNANPAGSTSGIAALNSFNGNSYAGTTSGTPDFARSSRGPNTTGGQCTGGAELSCDTFWGFAQDGIEVLSFNGRDATITNSAGLTPQDLYKAWSCQATNWSDLASSGITAGSADDGPIVVFGMNSSSGTFSTFNNYLINSGGAPSGYTVNANPCDQKVTVNGTAIYPFENDVKPLLASRTLDSSATSVNNPKNWLWFSSFGELSAFKYKASQTISGTPYNSVALPINGTLPSTSNILGGTYPIGRTLYHVTRLADADCPQTTAGTCDFTGNPGPTLPSGTGTDLNVTGGTSGTSGAVRELTRFLCRQRTATLNAIDPYTGVQYGSEITGATAAAGFTLVPSASRTAGSVCRVLT